MKKCIKCKKSKPKEKFYKHPGMKDGRLNKCVDCVKEGVSARVNKKKKDPAWMKNERARCRKKSAAYRAAGKGKTSNGVKSAWGMRNRNKTRAHTAAHRAAKNGLLNRPYACERCKTPGVRLVKHHPDYSKPLEVQWICDPCHGIVHRKP